MLVLAFPVDFAGRALVVTCPLTFRGVGDDRTRTGTNRPIMGESATQKFTALYQIELRLQSAPEGLDD